MLKLVPCCSVFQTSFQIEIKLPALPQSAEQLPEFRLSAVKKCFVETQEVGPSHLSIGSSLPLTLSTTGAENCAGTVHFVGQNASGLGVLLLPVIIILWKKINQTPDNMLHQHSKILS